MSNTNSPDLLHHGVDLTHHRLTELMRLADAAEPFYEWIEEAAKLMMKNEKSLSENLMVMSEDEVTALVMACHEEGGKPTTPLLFDGIGRQYEHHKAVYYFFAWLVRDAPVQRLAPIINRAKANFTRSEGRRVEARALGKLVVSYRAQLNNFTWEATREVVADRLEGSRRSVRGRAAEVVVRTSVSVALQHAFDHLGGGYGRFNTIKVANGEVSINGETFDVVIELVGSDGSVAEKVLMPVKTRETEGGGHSNLFTRDINSAMDVLRRAAAGTPDVYWMAPVIVAESWAPEQTALVRGNCDFVIALPVNPTTFESMPESLQSELNEFFVAVLSGSSSPKLLPDAP